MSVNTGFLQAIHRKFGEKGAAVAIASFSSSPVVSASGG